MDDLFATTETALVNAEEFAATTGSMVAVVETNPVVVFTDAARREKFYEDIKAEVSAHVADVLTAKGRDAVRALAFKVTKCKTGIDKAGLKLTEDARAQIDAVNAARKDVRERLDALAEEARKPLTEWEEAEEKRKNTVGTFFDRVAARAVVSVLDTSADVAESILQLSEMEKTIAADVFIEREPDARKAIADAKEALTQIGERLVKEEADKAELEKLRAEAEERRRQDEARLAAEAERVRQEQEQQAVAEAAERARQDEADRVARIEQEAAERAQREAEEKARAEQEAKDREYEAKIAEANRQAAEDRRRADEAEAARKAEADRIEQERIEKERADAAARAADEKRQADQKHRATIMKAAKEALMQHADIAEDVAKRVVLAITGSNVPAVTINF